MIFTKIVCMSKNENIRQYRDRSMFKSTETKVLLNYSTCMKEHDSYQLELTKNKLWIICKRIPFIIYSLWIRIKDLIFLNIIYFFHLDIGNIYIVRI